MAIQVFGVLFFLVISFYLPKDDFGIISWANAVSMFLTTILSCGMEQVIVRRIAASSKSDWAAVAYFFHTVAGSVIVYLLLLAAQFILPGSDYTMSLLPWFFAAQAIMYIGIPFKQYLNAKENFMPYGVIAMVSNIAKIVTAYILIRQHTLNMTNVIYILIAFALFELLALLLYVILVGKLKFSFRFRGYTKLIKESVPQYISVLFDTSLSRVDWILLGILSTEAATADYSFAYRAFEVARIPIYIIAPVIISRFARALAGKELDTEKKEQVNSFFQLEMFFAVLMVLCLNIIWGPWVDMLMKGKYGYSNQWEFLILSLCLPLHFFINLLWTLCFASKKYKEVLKASIIAAVSNLLLNLIFIPLWGGLGAAIAFLITGVIQVSIYYLLVRRHIMNFSVTTILILVGIGSISFYAAKLLTTVTAVQLVIAIVLFILLCLVSKQLNKKHISTLKMYLGR